MPRSSSRPSRAQLLEENAGLRARIAELEAAARDITERQSAEAKLRASEQQFRNYFELGIVGMAITSPKKGWVEYNDRLCEMLGYAREELKDLTWAQLTYPDDLPADLALFNRVIAGEIDGYSIDKRFLRKDGGVVSTSVAVHCLRHSDGTVDHFAAVLQDITARQLAEAALRESQAILQAAMDQSPAGIAIADAPEGVLRYVNDAGLLIRGGNRQTIIDGVGIDQYVASWQLLDLDGRPLKSDEVPLARAILFGETCSREFIVRRTSADDRIVLGNAAPIKDDAGQVVAGIVVFTDITESKRLEAERRKTTERLSLACRAGGIGIWEWDIVNNNLIWDELMFSVYGIAPDQFSGTYEGWRARVHPEDLPTSEQRLQLALRGEKDFETEFRVVWPNGTIHHLRALAKVQRDASGQPLSLIGTNYDITERRQAEAALAASQKLLQDVTDNSTSLVYALDAAGRFLLINRRLEAVFGVPRETMLAKPREAIMPPDLAAAHRANDLRVIAEGRPATIEEDNEEPDGRHTYLSTKYPLLDQQGAVYGISGISTDITERKRTEIALREANAYLESLFNYANAPIVVWDPQLRITRFNHAFEVLTGRTAPEVIGQSLAILFPPEQVAPSLALIQKTQAGERWESVEIYIAHRDGSVRTVLWDSATLYAEDGQTPLATIAQGQDITARIQAEAVVRESEERFRAVFEFSTIGKSLTAPDGTLLKINEAFAGMLGYTIAELQHANFAQITHPDDLPESQECIRCLLANEQSDYHMEKRYFHKDGRIVWAEVSTRMLRDDQGMALYLITSIQDITERKQAERIIQARLRLVEFATGHSLDELLQSTLDEVCALTDSPIGFFHFVEPDQQTLALQAWSTRTRQEYCRAEGPGLHYSVDQAGVWVDCIRERRPVLHNDYAALPHRRGLPVGHAELVRELVVPILREGLIVAILGVGNKARDYTENDTEVVAYFADIGWEIAERKRTENELHRLNAELEQRIVERTAQFEAANKELEAFAYSVSHDLRAPLRAIDGFSRIVLEEYAGQLPAEGRRFLGLVRSNTQQMGRLVDDLLAFSRLGRQPIKKQTVAPADLVRQALAELQAGPAQPPAQIVVGDLPECQADPNLLKQVWVNLLANALKFTRQQAAARIEVGCENQAGEVVYFVRDNGVGFDMRYADKLFGVFQRLHRAEDYEGTGVGLAIVQRIITRHGGRVWATAEPNHGASFYFSI